jgi:hypothetical protein
MPPAGIPTAVNESQSERASKAVGDLVTGIEVDVTN